MAARLSCVSKLLIRSIACIDFIIVTCDAQTQVRQVPTPAYYREKLFDESVRAQYQEDIHLVFSFLSYGYGPKEGYLLICLISVLLFAQIALFHSVWGWSSDRTRL